MSAPVRLTAPFSREKALELRAGDAVLLSGVVYTARDAAHKKLFALLTEGKPLPVDIRGQTLYYVGPTPARPGEVIGSAGPTTSSRVDGYTPALLEAGMTGMIGKGRRSPAVAGAMQAFGAVYFGALGGAGALIARHIAAAEVAAYPELGPEAVYRLTLDGLPLTVALDAHGGDLYKLGREGYLRG